MTAKRMIAVDLGASGGKCFVGEVENDKLTMSEIHRFTHDGVDYFVPDKSGNVSQRTYWDDTFIFNNIVIGLQNYRRDISNTLDSVGIDTWGSDGQFMTPDGDMIGKLYCYRDHRLDNMIDEVKARIDARRVYEITGIHFQPFNISNQLLWFMMNRSDLLLPGACFLPVPALFYFYLGGTRKVDSTFASVTQMMEAKTRQWSSEMFDKLGVPIEAMPEIVDPGIQIGTMLPALAAMIDINTAPLLSVGSHDTASAFAAAPVENTDDALIISSGTWSIVGKLIPDPITSIEAMEAGFSNEGGIGNIRFLKNVMGTWLVQELRRGWTVQDGKEPSWDELNKLTAAAPAFTTFVDPDDKGFYNPSDMEAAIAEFCKKTGQTPPRDRGVFLRMVYESLALKYRFVNEQLCSISGKETKVVNIVGGGTKNAMLNQFTADAVGVPVVAGPEEGTAVGNLMVQAQGLGIINSLTEALPIIRNSFPIKDYKPADTESWDKAYDRFKKILQ